MAILLLLDLRVKGQCVFLAKETLEWIDVVLLSIYKEEDQIEARKEKKKTLKRWIPKVFCRDDVNR